MKVRALVVAEKDAPFEIQEIDLGEPGRDEVLVRIVASGVCHTDAITRAGTCRCRSCWAMRAPGSSNQSATVYPRWRWATG
jgi:Zn-dependent alcohol dehydrogenase